MCIRDRARSAHISLPWATIGFTGHLAKGYIFTPSQVVYYTTNPTPVGNLWGSSSRRPTSSMPVRCGAGHTRP
eukprot:4734956-Alexandrium_andersonii.AAC.1